MNISIVGLGYVGAVSAACLADTGHNVWGVDINADKVRIINEGRSPIVESGLADKIARGRESGCLCATVDIGQALRETELCFVAVATPSRANGQIDPAHLFRACKQIAEALSKLRRKQTVVIRSSVLPSVFDECLRIFDSKAPGLVELCANPEFLREGTAIRDFEEPPFTILGTNAAAAEAILRSLYSEQSAPIFVLEPREALMVKYASNAFHALKVAFSNEIAAVCQQTGLNAEAVMNVFCNDTKLNISRRYLMPGFAFGGSCLPKDVRAILHAGKEFDLQLPIIAATLLSNECVIDRAFEKVRATGKRRIGLIGLSFKSNTDDLRESPFVELAERLLGKGYELRIYDPNVISARLTGANKEYIDSVIPHLSRLLVRSLDELSDAELLIVGHRFDGVSELLENRRESVIDLNSYETEPRATLKSELVLEYGD
ncbi:MAG TPA: nucleotide sugar dehydrogenase [Candidatus Dormibacteraeota bacterium]|jgi:GDP-mannose 6-dehydrogenase|nr:nucleotide sugar dehydrogenase [Candidatus Dormibacteraeota bacterium]